MSIIRDETLTKLRLISHVAIALLIGALYWNIGKQINLSAGTNRLPVYTLFGLKWISLYKDRDREQHLV
jgi:hypothetical protein